MSQYAPPSGTADFTNGSTKVLINVLTAAEISANISVGDTIKVLNEFANYDIITVDVSTPGDLHLHISPAYGGTTVAGASFVVSRDWTSNLNFPEFNRQDVNAPQILTLELIRPLDNYLSGGTVLPQAAAFFNANKQAATTSASGVVELATEAEAITGIDTARAVTPAGLKQAADVLVNPKAYSQGLQSLAGAAAGILVADDGNIDMGTNNFTIAWRGSLPDWTPASAQYLRYQISGAGPNYDGLQVYIDTDGTIVLKMFRNDPGVTFTSTVATGLADGTEHEIVIAVQRETASVAGSVTFYVDGVVLGAAVAITAAAPVSISSSGTLYLSGSAATRYASVLRFVALFNRALTAAEVIDLYRNGIAYADQWGSQTAKYTSDFSAGVDDWYATRSTVAGNIDGIGGQDDTLRGYASNDNDTHTLYNAGASVTALQFKKLRVSLSYYIPSANTNVKRVGLHNMNVVPSNTNCVAIGTTTDSWTTLTGEIENTHVNGYAPGISMGSAGAWSFVGANDVADDLIYIKNVTITEIGATLALEPEGIQPSPGQWLDSSSNKLHALQPATGTAPLRPLREFEVRDTLTWSASHEPKNVNTNYATAGVTGTDQAMLPADNVRITEITGVVDAGLNGVNVIIGDGSDTDHWVSTVAMATGVQVFTVANPNHDGTNRKVVVDPAGNVTGSLALTIRGVILQ